MRRWSRVVAGSALVLAMVVLSGTSGMTAAVPVLPGTAEAPKPLPLQWWFTAWDIQSRVWPITQGQGVTVGLLDTGVEASLPDLSGAVLPGVSAGGTGDGRVDMDDSEVPGHGTGMASLIAAQGTGTGFVGVAPQAKILPIVSSEVGGHAQGIRLAVDRGAKVINISQGEPTGRCTEVVQEAVSYALERDVVVIAAAGNDGNGLNSSMSPANCAGVLAVGAVDSTTRPFVDTQRQPYVAVAAPGVGVSSVLKDGRIHTSNGGTSGATALTSGAAALVRSRFPQMSAREVVQRLIASTRDAGPVGRDNLTGFGVVRPFHALTAELPTSAPNPVFGAYDRWKAENAEGPSRNASPESGISGLSVIVMLGIGLVVALLILLVAILLYRSRRPLGVGAPPHGWPDVPPQHGGPYGEPGVAQWPQQVQDSGDDYGQRGQRY